jgi:hypothetical protein
MYISTWLSLVTEQRWHFNHVLMYICELLHCSFTPDTIIIRVIDINWSIFFKLPVNRYLAINIERRKNRTAYRFYYIDFILLFAVFTVFRKSFHTGCSNLISMFLYVIIFQQMTYFFAVQIDIQYFFQSGSEFGPWTNIIGNSCLVIQTIHLYFLWFFYFQCKSTVLDSYYIVAYRLWDTMI